MNESSDLELPFHEDNIQIEDNKHNLNTLEDAEDFIINYINNK